MKGTKSFNEMDKINNRICSIGCIIYILTIVIALILKIGLHHKYEVPCIVFAVGAIAYVMVMARINGNIDTIKNRAIITYSGLTKMVFLFGCTFENKLFTETALNRPDDPMLFVAYGFGIISVILESFMFIRNKKSRALRIYVLFIFLLVYYLAVANIYSFWVLLMLMPILTAYTQFEDIKLILLACFLSVLVSIDGVFIHLYFADTGNIIASSDPVSFSITAIRHCLSTEFDKEMLYLMFEYILILGFLLVYSVVMIRVTAIVKQINQSKITIIEEEQNKIEMLIEKILDIGKKIKLSIYDTNKLVNDLDNSIYSSGEVLEKITTDNENNVLGIEKQTEITLKISDLINNLATDVDEISKSAKKSLEELNKSRSTFENLKTKSNKIYKNNSEMIRAINEFVDNTRQVKNITSGIENISEETNLLSLNASIKSARAGNVGKGFAVVADEVRVLADETANLTKDINKIVDKLENSAIITQNIISQVADAIKNENITIDKTMVDFNEMENNIHGLSNNIFEISDIVDEVTKFKDEIENHIEILMTSSESVTSNTEEVDDINLRNKEKIDDTRKLMEEMLKTAEKLEEYYV